MACLLCMLTSQLHQVDVILVMQLCMLTPQLHDDDIIIIRVSHMGRVNWYSGRVGSAHLGKEDVWHAWGVCGHVRRLSLTPFSPVASSLPPLHSGMIKTQF
jgi:hypothetical protein